MKFFLFLNLTLSNIVLPQSERVLQNAFDFDQDVLDLEKSQKDIIKQETDERKTIQKCNKDILISYGMEGQDYSEVREHAFCPNIIENCCTVDDAIRSKFLWNNQSRFLLERYYQTTLITLKYLLGYSNEGYLLARKYETQYDKKCKQAAVDLISMDFNMETTEMVYNELKKTLVELSEIRRGFYCIICDASQQKELMDFWVSTNNFFTDRIYFSKQFCSQLVDKTIQASFYMTKYVRRYLNNMGTLLNCESNVQIETHFQISYQQKQDIYQCYYFKDRMFFFFCEKYCEYFQTTKFTNVFDGDLQQLDKFFDHFKTYRHSSFKYPNNNFLCDGVNFEEELLTFNYGVVFQDLVFFRPTNQTDVVYYGGMNPWQTIMDNKYEMMVYGVPLWPTLYFIIVLALFF